MNKQVITKTVVEDSVIHASKVRSICIKMDWYTRGTVDEYTNMLTNAELQPPTPAIIYEIAKDIYDHSDMSNYASDYTENEIIENIMCYIGNDAVTRTYAIK